jgi:hypothetical protein
MFQRRHRLSERIFEKHENFAPGLMGEGIAEGEIVRCKDIFREENAQLPADLDGALDDSHGSNLRRTSGFDENFLSAAPESRWAISGFSVESRLTLRALI